MAALVVLAVLVIFVAIVLGSSVRVLREYERGVIFRLGRLIAQKGPGADPADPDDRPHGQGRPAHGDPQHPAAGGDHPRQRPRRRQRGRLLPRDRLAQSDRRGRKLPARHLADLADGAALGARQGRVRPAALRARAAQRGAAEDHRRVDRALGRQGDRGRDQGRRDPRADAAGDRPPGRGRARAPRQDHQLRGRVPGGAEAHRRGRHHQHQPGLAAAALPADAARNRQQPEHDRGLPAADGHARAVHRPFRSCRRGEQSQSPQPSAASAAPRPLPTPTTSPPPAPERTRDTHRPAVRAADDPRARPRRPPARVRAGGGATRRAPRAARSARAARRRRRPRSTRCAPVGGEPDTPGWTSRVVPNLYPALGDGEDASDRRHAAAKPGPSPAPATRCWSRGGPASRTSSPRDRRSAGTR